MIDSLEMRLAGTRHQIRLADSLYTKREYQASKQALREGLRQFESIAGRLQPQVADRLLGELEAGLARFD